MTNLLKEAIAEAKEVRATAYSNAKQALEEQFAPHLQSMIAAKLQEMESEDEEHMGTGKDEKDMNEGEYMATGEDEKDMNEGEEDFNLEEILAELDMEEAHEEPDADNMGGPSDHDADNEEEDEENKMGEEGEEEIGEMTVQELKDLIQQIVDEEMAGAGENEEGKPEDEMGGENFGQDVAPPMENPALEEEETINLEELLAELSIEEGDDDLEEGKTYKDDKFKEKAMKQGMKQAIKQDMKQDMKQYAKYSKELKEAYAVITYLKKELNEINLLNSRLLYVNKLFKENGSLTESQKIKIVKSFDEVSTVKEAKLVYRTLTEGLATKRATKGAFLKESLSFASKAAGTSSNNIIEANPIADRFKALINYNK
jgi:hypothetical protein